MNKCLNGLKLLGIIKFSKIIKKLLSINLLNLFRAPIILEFFDYNFDIFCLIRSLQLLMIRIDNIYFFAIAGRRYNYQALIIMSFSIFVILDSEIGWQILEVFAIKHCQIGEWIGNEIIKK